jgi:hypothetical protein
VIYTELTVSQREGSTALLQFLEDAHEFAIEFHFVADLAPLQLYASAVVFAPEKSPVKAAFRYCSPGWLIQPPIMPQTWGTDALKLEAQGGFAATVFSPDDKYIATCSHNGTVRVWDSETGVCLSTLDSSGKDEPYAAAPTPYVKTMDPYVAALAFSSCNSLAKVSFSARKREELRAATFKIVIFQSIELRDTKEVTCDAPGGSRAELAFSPESNEVLHTAVSRETDGTSTLDLWRLAIGVGTMECIWSRSTSNPKFRMFGVSAELRLVACR